MKKILYYAIAFSFSFTLSSCVEDLTYVEVPKNNPEIEVTLDGTSILDSEVQVEYEKSKTLDFVGKAMSYVKAIAPEGWEVVTSMDNGKLTIKAPSYKNASAAASGPVTLNVYDGDGGHIEKSFTVSGVECETVFSIEETTGIQKFSLASKKFFKYSKSPNLTSFNATAPKGWVVETQEDGVYVTAPIWTPESGFEQDGTISIIPVSFKGKSYDDKKADISVHVDENATFQFANPGNVTFNPSEEKEIEMIIAGMKSIDQVIAPKGWTVDCSSLLETQKFKVTAPAEGGDIETIGAITIVGTQAGLEKSVTSDGIQTLRFRGINNIQDLVDFRTAHGAEATEAPDADKVSDFTVNGELKFNQDITLESKDMYQKKNPGQFFMQNLFIPVNGNGHTLSINISSDGASCSLFNTLSASIHDLTVAGTITTGNAAVSVAALAQVNGASIDLTNVNSSVNITLNGTTGNALVGGLIQIGGKTFTLKMTNCKVSGDIVSNVSLQRCGGLMSTGTNDGKGGTGFVSMNNCEFSGNIIFNKNKTVSKLYANSRIGGIFGSQERDAEMIGCVFSGHIYLYLHGSQLYKSTGGGVGGMMGRCNAVTSGYKMNTVMKNCTSSGKIHVMNKHASEYVDNYQMLVGVNLGTCTPENCTVSGSVVFDE